MVPSRGVPQEDVGECMFVLLHTVYENRHDNVQHHQWWDAESCWQPACTDRYEGCCYEIPTALDGGQCLGSRVRRE